MHLEVSALKSCFTVLICPQQHHFETKQIPDQLLSAELEEIT